MTEGSERLERDVGGGRRGEGAAHFRLLPAAHVTFPPRSSRLILVSLRSFLSVIGPSFLTSLYVPLTSFQSVRDEKRRV